MNKSLPTRYVLVFYTFFLTILLYIDRICISAAKGPISEALDLNDKQFGWIMSSFALGYALFQTPSGILLDKKGPRTVITMIVSAWSVMTAVTGMAWNFISMLLIRFLFGMGEAGAFPGISKSSISWFPVKERGIVTGINFSGSRLGAAFAMPFVIYLINSFGWRISFLILGLIGVVWAVFWHKWFRDQPEEHSSVSKEELAYIVEHRQKIESQSAVSVSWLDLLKKRQVWYIMIQYFASNYIFFFCLTWLFPFLKSKYQMDETSLSYWMTMPFLAGAIGNYFSGYLVDYLYKNEGIIISRRLPAVVGFLLIAIGLIANLGADSVYSSIAFLSLAIFGADMTLSPSWSYCMDVGKNYTGILSGTMNMAGNLGAFLTALAFPYLMSWTGNENTFFYIGIALSFLAIYCWSKMNPEKTKF
jgi:MFS transporter, ACS family, glucarate transporter